MVRHGEDAGWVHGKAGNLKGRTEEGREFVRCLREGNRVDGVVTVEASASATLYKGFIE